MSLPTIVAPTYTLVQPSTGKPITFRPFLVKEEKILLMAVEAEDPQETIRAIKSIITNCCQGLGEVDDIPLFDLEYIFLQLRGKSVGEIAEPVVKCSKCEKSVKLRIDLTKVAIHRTEGHTRDIKLTNEIGVKMRYPGFSAMALKFVQNDPSVEQLFDSIAECIESVYDTQQQYPAKDFSKEDIRGFLESLTQSQFEKIQAFFETSPTLKHKVDYVCQNKVKAESGEESVCNHKGQVVLSTVNDFFS